MRIFESRLWNKDIEEVEETIPELEELNGKNILITGASGLVCSPIVDILLHNNATHNSFIKLYIAGRSAPLMKSRFGLLEGRADIVYINYDATRADNEIPEQIDYIIHGASNASPNVIVKEPVETMLSNYIGIKYLLDYAVSNHVKRVLYVSSSEVYGNKSNNKPYSESEYGSIDILKSRNSYSISKCAAETMCAAYHDEYGVDSVIVRPGHIYGPTASKNDSRVGSAWAYAAAKGENIVMKSDGRQKRSYVYALDCASAILKVLLIGKTGCAYNISNPNSLITISDLGKMLAEFGNVELTVARPNEDDKCMFNPMTNSTLDSMRLLELGWHGCFDAARGLKHTVDIIKELLC